jgi:hypothetical protein
MAKSGEFGNQTLGQVLVDLDSHRSIGDPAKGRSS